LVTKGWLNGKLDSRPEMQVIRVAERVKATEVALKTITLSSHARGNMCLEGAFAKSLY
jgi:hypothetical protein